LVVVASAGVVRVMIGEDRRDLEGERKSFVDNGGGASFNAADELILRFSRPGINVPAGRNVEEFQAFLKDPARRSFSFSSLFFGGGDVGPSFLLNIPVAIGLVILDGGTTEDTMLRFVLAVLDLRISPLGGDVGEAKDSL